MAHYEILDDHEKRSRRNKRRLVWFSVICSLAILCIPEVRDYAPRWRALVGARQLGLFLSRVRSSAALKKESVEVLIKDSKTIEVSTVDRCLNTQTRRSMANMSLSEWQSNLVFLSAEHVKSELGFEKPYLERICYDALTGIASTSKSVPNAAVGAESQAFFFLGDNAAVESKKSYLYVLVKIDLQSGDFQVE